MTYKEVTGSTAAEWEAFCRAAYTEYTKKHSPPFIAFFWSASAYTDSYQEWSKGYAQHIQEAGNKFWEEYGHYVVDWNMPPHQQIVIRPLTDKQAT